MNESHEAPVQSFPAIDAAKPSYIIQVFFIIASDGPTLIHFARLDGLAEKGTPNRFLRGSKSLPIFPGVALLQNQHEANASDMKTAYSRYLNTWVDICMYTIELCMS